MLNDQTIKNYCLPTLQIREYSIYIYGSSSEDLTAGRDIDVVLFSKSLSKVHLSEIRVKNKGKIKILNIYKIPDSLFKKDVELLSYGGYYAHKFAFSFRELYRSSNSIDGPRIFWTSAINRALAMNNQLVSASEIVRYTHKKIVQIRPTVLRSLSKFLRQNGALERLTTYVNTILMVLQKKPTTLHPILIKNERVAFHLFWQEYARLKAENRLLNTIVMGKMCISLQASDLPIALRYLGP